MNPLEVKGFTRAVLLKWVRDRLLYELGRKKCTLTTEEILEKYGISFLDFTLITKDNLFSPYMLEDWHPPSSLYVSVGGRKGECPSCKYYKVLDVRKKICYSCFENGFFDSDPGLNGPDGYRLTAGERRRLDEVRRARTPPIPIPVFDDKGKIKKVDLS
jgi:hypothetical protein